MARDVTLTELGVHRAAPLDGQDIATPYVQRDLERELRTLLRTVKDNGGFIVIAGESGAGKSRLAAEVVQDLMGDHLLSIPETAEQLGAVGAAIDQVPETAVLWLDDLDRFLSPAGLTSAVLDQLLGRRMIIVATLRAGRRIDRSGIGAAKSPEARLLERATTVHLDRVWSADEVALAGETDDARLADAADVAGSYGIAEYLAAGPQIVAAHRDAWAPDHQPRAAALIAAAVDFARAGLFGALPVELLAEAHDYYLDQRGGRRLRPESFDRAIAWAAALRCGTTSPLQPGDDDRTYQAFDYLVDHAEAADTAVPDVVWRSALAFTKDKPARHFIVGLTAWRLGFAEPAYTSWRYLAEEGYGPGLFWLGLFYEHNGRVDKAEEYFHRAVEAGDLHGAQALARLCAEREEIREAESWYEKAADSRHLPAAGLRAQLHRDRGEWQQAVYWFVREFEAGDTLDALHMAAEVCSSVGRPDLAAGWYDAALEVGSIEAIHMAANFAYFQQDWRRLERLCEALRESSAVDGRGAVEADQLIGMMLRDQGDLAGAEVALRRAHDAGDDRASMSLSSLLTDQGRQDEADEVVQHISIQTGDGRVLKWHEYLAEAAADEKPEPATQ